MPYSSMLQAIILFNAVGDPVNLTPTRHFKAKGDVIGRKTDRERIMAAGHEMLF